MFTKIEFVTLLGRRRICREYTHVDSPKHDVVVDRRIAITLELTVVRQQRLIWVNRISTGSIFLVETGIQGFYGNCLDGTSGTALVVQETGIFPKQL